MAVRLLDCLLVRIPVDSKQGIIVRGGTHDNSCAAAMGAASLLLPRLSGSRERCRRNRCCLSAAAVPAVRQWDNNGGNSVPAIRAHGTCMHPKQPSLSTYLCSVSTASLHLPIDKKSASKGAAYAAATKSSTVTVRLPRCARAVQRWHKSQCTVMTLACSTRAPRAAAGPRACSTAGCWCANAAAWLLQVRRRMSLLMHRSKLLHGAAAQ